MHGANYVRLVGAFLDCDIVCLDCLKTAILAEQPEACVEFNNDMYAWLLQWQIKGNSCSPVLAFEQAEWVPGGLHCDRCFKVIFETAYVRPQDQEVPWYAD
jgi:hypothetical protein